MAWRHFIALSEPSSYYQPDENDLAEFFCLDVHDILFMNRNFVSDIFIGNFILGIASTALTDLILGYTGDNLQATWGIDKTFFRYKLSGFK